MQVRTFSQLHATVAKDVKVFVDVIVARGHMTLLEISSIS